MSKFIQVDEEYARALAPVLLEAKEQGLEIEFESGYRSSEHQAQLYARYLQLKQEYDEWVDAGRPEPPKMSPLPAAPPGFSLHECGLADDTKPKRLLPAREKWMLLERFGLICEKHGLRWGGRFGDPVHHDLGNTYGVGQAKRLGFPHRLVWITIDGEIHDGADTFGAMPIIDGAPRATRGR